MKYLGIDYGSKRIGVAVSNAEGTIAFPRGVMSLDGAIIEAIALLARNEKIETVIVGDTRSVEGRANPVTASAEIFMASLAKALPIPIIPMWEAWSSIEASRYAPKGKEHDDAAAAAIILQRYLDTKKNDVQ